MPDYHQPFAANSIYHIFSRTTGTERLFRNEANYAFFLHKYFQHVAPVADTFGYCLLPNHFHLLLRFKSAENIQAYFERRKPGKAFTPGCVADFLGERLANWLNSYVKAFNRMHDRHGGLLENYLKRVRVEGTLQFL